MFYEIAVHLQRPEKKCSVQLWHAINKFELWTLGIQLEMIVHKVLETSGGEHSPDVNEDYTWPQFLHFLFSIHNVTGLLQTLCFHDLGLSVLRPKKSELKSVKPGVKYILTFELFVFCVLFQQNIMNKINNNNLLGYIHSPLDTTTEGTFQIIEKRRM